MSLNPSGTGGSSWNFSKPDKEGFSLEFWGTVVSLQEVQAREYNPNNNQPGRPAFWPDGNPKMNIRVGFATPDGSLKSITFGKAGKKQVSGEKPSLHMQLFKLTNNNMMELMGKTLHLWTWTAHPETNQPWGQGNPRLFGVEEITDARYELRGQLPPEFLVPELYCNGAVAGGQPVAPSPQSMQMPQVPPMQGNFYAAPTMQQPMQQPVQQFNPMQAYQQPAPVAQPNIGAPMGMQQQPVTQTMPPQQQQVNPMPQGMDPAVAQAMQAVGAQNVQEVIAGGIYDDDMPF